MKEHDPLHALLREWEAPEPSPEFDSRMVSAYRDAVVARDANRLSSIWAGFWKARISVPAPVLAVAVLVAVAGFLLLRGTSAPKVPPTANLVTHLNATGFQPLPNGEARVIPVTELKK